MSETLRNKLILIKMLMFTFYWLRLMKLLFFQLNYEFRLFYFKFFTDNLNLKSWRIINKYVTLCSAPF